MSKFQKRDWVIPEETPTLSDFDRIRLETAVSFTCAIASTGQNVDFQDGLFIADAAINMILNQPFKRTE